MDTIKPNIVLTYRCVNRCPYCFSAETRKQPQRATAAELTLEELDYYLDLIRRSGSRNLKLLGGEPFVYRHIDAALDRILRDDWFRRIRIFTAGFIDRCFYPQLADPRVSLLVNVNSPADYPADRYPKLVRSLKDLAAVPVRFWLGYNIYREDFDYQPVVSLAHALGVPTLRWAIASPSFDGSTRCLDREGRRRVIPRLLQFLRAALDADLLPQMDCPLEPCLFSDEQLGTFARMCPSDAADLGHCGPVIDLAPGYKALRCFAAGPAFTVDVRSFASLQEVFDHFMRTCEFLRPAAAPPACRDCRSFSLRQCSGGCVASRYGELTRLQTEQMAAVARAAPVASDAAAARRRLTAFNPYSAANLVQRAVQSADNSLEFLRIMEDHRTALRQAPGTRLLWARYHLNRNDPAAAARCLHQSLYELGPQSEPAAQVRQTLSALDSGSCQSVSVPLPASPP